MTNNLMLKKLGGGAITTNSWLTDTAQTGLTGDKTGSFNLTTTGQVSVGDLSIPSALTTHGEIDSYQTGNSMRAGAFYDITGTYQALLGFNDPNNPGVFASALFSGQNITAGYDTVNLTDGTYAINATGDGLFTGTLTASRMISGIAIDDTTTPIQAENTTTTTVDDVSGSGITFVDVGTGTADQGMGASGYFWEFYIYAYKNVGGVRVYSANPLDFNNTDDGLGESFNVQLDWTAVTGADGYIIRIVEDDYYGTYGETEINITSGATTTFLFDGSYLPYGAFPTLYSGWVAPTTSSSPFISPYVVNSTVANLIGDTVMSGAIIDVGGQNSGITLPDTSISPYFLWMPTKYAFAGGHSAPTNISTVSAGSFSWGITPSNVGSGSVGLFGSAASNGFSFYGTAGGNAGFAILGGQTTTQAQNAFVGLGVNDSSYSFVWGYQLKSTNRNGYGGGEGSVTMGYGDSSGRFESGGHFNGDSKGQINLGLCDSGYQHIAFNTGAMALGHNVSARSYENGTGIGWDCMMIGSGYTNTYGNSLALGINSMNAFIENTGVTVLSNSSLGAEKITNGTFTGSATGWTLASPYVVYSSNSVVFDNAGGTATQTSAGMVTPLVVGEWYELSYTWTNNGSQEAIAPTIGGVTLDKEGYTGESNTTTYKRQFKALSTASLVFTGINGTLDNVSLKKILGGDLNTASITLRRATNGKCGTFVCTGATPVTISNTSIAITDCIIISLNTVGGTVGATPHVATITASTGFTTVGTALDTSTYNYAVISNA